MRKIIIVMIALLFCTVSASALEYTAPDAPESAQPYMKEDPESFSDGLLYIIKSAISELRPSLAEAGRVCLTLIAIMLLASIIKNFSSTSKQIVDLVTALCVATTLIQSSNSMIHLGAQTVGQISDYGKLLLPVMTASLAAQGGTTTSAALYTGTAFFNTILSSAITKLIVPMVYVNMALCIGYSAIGEEILKNIRNFSKWLITWSLKTILYVFTGYLSITGVVSGTTDAAVLKAAKLTVSGVVPVVGKIVSDASETILVSACVIKNTVGVYGLLAIAAVWIGPFIQIGTQYLLLKLTCTICATFGQKETVGLIKDFSELMGILVAMTSCMCILLLVSVICYLKGVG